ncbi:MAG: radical SAM protein [Halanaerobiales bacterium]|nr:radical SAM protein [Halanaerobiales bacterium]
MGLILNSRVRLKKNQKRILIYTLEDFTDQPSEIFFIHPVYAVLLTMFDGIKTYEQVLKEFCFIIHQEYNEKNKNLIEKEFRVIEKNLKIKNILVKDEKTNPLIHQKYCVDDFIIPNQEINLDYENQKIDFPIIVNYNVTSSCKMNCKYCYHSKDQITNYIPLERLEILFDECVKKGCEYVLLSGGDPFERKDFIDIMELLHKKGLSYFTSTKSYLDQKTCLQLKEKGGLNKIQISLDSHKPELAAFLTGMDIEFLDRTVQTIKNLKEAEIAVGLRCVVNGYNIDDLDNFLDFCSSLEVERVDLIQYSRSIWRHVDSLFPTEEQMIRANEVVNRYKHKFNTPIIGHYGFQKEVFLSKNHDSENPFEFRSICNSCRTSVILLPDGQVTICEQLPYIPEVILGNLNDQSIEAFWNSKKVSKFLSPPQRSKYQKDIPCKTCNEDDYQICHKYFSICLKHSYDYFRNFSSPDLQCKYADVDHFRIR